MATQYTTILKLALPTQGELSGTWGDVVNDNITEMVEEAIAGRKVINTWTTNSHTLTTADGTTSESRAAILTLTDTGTALTGAGTVICPANSKVYIVENGTGQTITVKTSSGTGVAVPDGKNMVVFCDGTNVEESITNINSLTLNGDGATVSSIKDEDNMASDSATALATQQSIKAYVDSQVGTVDTLAEVLANGNTTGGTDIAVSTGDDITFADNSRAIFGAGSDLLISSDGTASLIQESGPGALNIQGTHLNLRNAAGSSSYLTAVDGGAVTLFSSGSAKLATTSTGIDVTGSVVSDGLTVDASTAVVQASNAGGTTSFEISNTNGVATANNKAALYLSATGAEANAARIESDFTGTVATNHAQDLKFYYVGVSSSPALGMTLDSSGNVEIHDGYLEVDTETSAAAVVRIDYNSTDSIRRIHALETGGGNARPLQIQAQDVRFRDDTSERMRIDSSGNVGIGATSLSNKLTVNGDQVLLANGELRFADATNNQVGTIKNNGGAGTSQLDFITSGVGRMLIDSSGQVGIGVTSPSGRVHADGDAYTAFIADGTSGGAFKFYKNGSQHAQIFSDGSGDIVFRNNTDSERMRIDSSGAINVQGDSINAQTSAAYYIRNRVNGGSLNLGVETSAGALYYPITMSGTSNVTIFNNATTELARFLSNGNFGIGTTSATTILEIQDANAQLTIDSELSTFSRVVHQHNGTSVWTTGTRSASDYHIFRESGSGNVIVDAGNVGIETSSTFGKLSINSNGAPASSGSMTTGLTVHNSTGGTAINIGTNDSGAYNYIQSAYVNSANTARNLAFFAGAARAVDIDTSGRVGIDTSSPYDPLTIGDGTVNSMGLGIKSTNTGNNYIHFGDTDSNSAGRILYDHNSDNLQFNTGETLRGYFSDGGLTVTANNGSSSHMFTFNENGGEIQLYNAAGSIATLIDQVNTATRVLELQNGSTFQLGHGSSNTTGIIEFRSAGFGLAGVIDANANWLFGKSGTALGTAGVEINQNGVAGKVWITRSGGEPLVLNRETNDGTLLELYQGSGTQVGVIRSRGGAVSTIILDPRSNGSGLTGSTNGLLPTNEGGGISDDGVDLGSSTARFRDIYAGNATIQTSDRNEKQDIEELSEAEQRVAVACKGLLRKFRWKSSVEEKGDDARIHFGIIAQDLQDAFTAEGLDAGRYGMFINSTWTDEETGEERSRMGVRYSELLAFIISAI